jgi:hypothetical protein
MESRKIRLDGLVCCTKRSQGVGGVFKLFEVLIFLSFALTFYLPRERRCIRLPCSQIDFSTLRIMFPNTLTVPRLHTELLEYKPYRRRLDITASTLFKMQRLRTLNLGRS